MAEARRRHAISDRDLSASVEHFVRSVRTVCDGWGLEVEGWFAGGAGTPTLAVVTTEGTAGVLKLDRPGTLDTAARVMRAANARGYARVLAWDPHRGALLTERLGHTAWAEAPTLDQQGPLIARVLADAWQVPLDSGSPFPRKASQLLASLAELGPRYGTGHVDALAHAARCATELAASEQPEVVCHGDPHAGNVLRRGAQWALIDPDGFVGERAYDLGVVLRDGCREIAAAEASAAGSGRALLCQACHDLAERAQADPERVWRWAFLERVTTGLYLRWHGYAEESATFLSTASMLVR